jgi:serine/threonine-protein kinase RIO1
LSNLLKWITVYIGHYGIAIKTFVFRCPNRNFSIKEGKRKKRVHDKIEKSTSDQAVDPTTRLLLFKMINNGYLESIHGIISTGKEAIIIYADGGPGKTL